MKNFLALPNSMIAGLFEILCGVMSGLETVARRFHGVVRGLEAWGTRTAVQVIVGALG